MLDTVREIHTPEGVALRLPAAGPVPRAFAWLIDLSIRFALVLVASMFLGFLGRVGIGVYLVFLFLVVWAYPVAFEAMWDGQTPGKRAMRLRVLAADGAPIGWMAAFVRNLMRTVDMLPFGYAFGLSSSLIDPWGRRLGDIVARTMVVHAPRVREAAGAHVNAIHAPPVPLLPGEQAAVIAFAERAGTLTPQRQQELAGIAEPLTGAQGDAGVVRLFGVANWLTGRRA
ncbi:RDD family protein [Luteimonas marina]|uniref:RDD family protein n=1 Tax=Luteimonas marina TaxID=488485 RepID=A0A5C5U9B1_9GAMM|nr:RDD family protein [Luteimonas marina]TWT22478.1 RDD family protein [Luteimonas marina]